jgi:pimeloyl-ACP methyl ester carboxylesterase
MPAAEVPFNVSVSDDKIALLKAKLDTVTFPDELDDAGWKYGAPLADIKRLVARWNDGYDWKHQESILNQALPQFVRDIDVEGFGTLNIHYVYQKSECVDAIPLLFVHGWPGSPFEVKKLLPLLTATSPEYPSFDVVAYSLPGYAFSEAPKKRGFGLAQYAEVGNKLMLALGYNEYVTQGGDWGHMVTRKIANIYGGKHSRAWHTNMGHAQRPHPLRTPLRFLLNLVIPNTPAEKAGLARTKYFIEQGRGYDIEQSTRPQTIGYALADSPVGLLAWMYEKLVDWTDDYPWTDDEVLTWVSIYWFSRAGPAASCRIYYEVGEVVIEAPVPKIPMGVSFFPKELVNWPRAWVRATGNVVFTSEHTHGGHFAAHEQPEALAGDLRKMFGKGGAAFGVVPGKAGYSKL